MPSLHDVQKLFIGKMASVDYEPQIQLAPARLSSKQQFQIYQNNILIKFTEALRAVYPVIYRLVGEDFFSQLAQHYIFDERSSSRRLNESGEYFSSFLNKHFSRHQLDYLPDMAQLEWAYYVVNYAAYCVKSDWSLLTKISEEDFDKVKFTLHPASALLSSSFSVLFLWERFQQEKEFFQAIELPNEGENILVIRRDWEVEMKRLTLGEFALLQAIFEEKNWGEVCENVLSVDERFDVGECLRHHIFNGTIMNFEIGG